MTRLLIGGLVALIALLVLSAIIVTLAPYIAAGIVLFVLWKLHRSNPIAWDEIGEDNPPAVRTVQVWEPNKNRPPVH